MTAELPKQKSVNGQIRREDGGFGDFLFQLFRDKVFRNALEVGTWMGNGTTRCVVDGFLASGAEREFHFYSLETNREIYLEAQRLWNLRGLPFLHLLYGRLHEDGILYTDIIEADPDFEKVKEHYNLYFDQDRIDYHLAPLVPIGLLPEEIDVLILDGGEFSGMADWLALQNKKPQIVCLDDILTMKNKKVVQILEESGSWTKIAGSDDRNGWAVFERKSV